MTMPRMVLLFLALLLAILSAAPPYLIGRAVDLSDSASGSFTLVVSLACLAILTAPLIKLLANIFTSYLTQATRLSLKKLIIPIYLRRLGEFNGAGQVISLVEGDVDGALYLYHRLYFDLALNVSSIGFSLLVLMAMSPLLVIPPLVSILVGVMICWSSRRSTNQVYEEYVNKETILLGQVCQAAVDGTTAINSKDIGVIEVGRAAYKANFRSASANALSSSAYCVGVALLFYIWDILFAHEKITVGALMAALMYIDRVMAPANALVAVFYATREASVRLSRIKNME